MGVISAFPDFPGSSHHQDDITCLGSGILMNKPSFATIIYWVGGDKPCLGHENQVPLTEAVKPEEKMEPCVEQNQAVDTCALVDRGKTLVSVWVLICTYQKLFYITCV